MPEPKVPQQIGVIGDKAHIEGGIHSKPTIDPKGIRRVGRQQNMRCSYTIKES